MENTENEICSSAFDRLFNEEVVGSVFDAFVDWHYGLDDMRQILGYQLPCIKDFRWNASKS